MSTTAQPPRTTSRTFVVRGTTTPTSAEDRARLLTDPGFGRVFTDHMALIDWAADASWTGHRVVPRAPLQMDPAAAVLHYGQEIFEGIKAFRHADGSVWTLRPEANAARFVVSARRMAMPELPSADFLASLEALVQVDADWVPESDEASLYLSLIHI